MNPQPTMTADERAYLTDHLDGAFSPVVQTDVHRTCVARGYLVEFKPGWFHVTTGIARGLRMVLAIARRAATKDGRPVTP